jgi:hypothetical protein
MNKHIPEMTLRDYFAAKAMEAFLHNFLNNYWDVDYENEEQWLESHRKIRHLTFSAYVVADDMIESRKIDP